MSIHIIPATDEIFEEMKGQKFSPHDGEGIVYIKLAMIKPDTLENGDPQAVVENAQGVFLCGQFNEIKDQINQWFNQSAQQYQS